MSFQNKYEFRKNKIATSSTIHNTIETEVAEIGMNSCINELDFAEICGFLQKFSRNIQLTLPRFRDLQLWLQTTDEFPKDLQRFIAHLLQRGNHTVHRKIDQDLIKFCHTYSAQDARILEESDGFHTLSLRQKLRFLKELLESLFFSNERLSRFCEKKSATELRIQPLGCDRYGCHYTLEQKNIGNWAVYKHNEILKYFRPIAITREEILDLILKLSATSSSLSDSGVADEDSNSSSPLLLIENEEDLILFLKVLSSTLFK